MKRRILGTASGSSNVKAATRAMFRCSGSWNSFGAIYYWTRLCGAYTMDATATNSNQCKYFSPSVLPDEYSWNEYVQKPKVFPIRGCLTQLTLKRIHATYRMILVDDYKHRLEE